MEDKQQTLAERMYALRSKTDIMFPRNSYVMIMFDGRSFSKLVKNKFKLPFDERFVDVMNKTAEVLCHEIQGAKFAYVQSDEISLFFTDVDCEGTGSFFKYRLTKMLSVGASIATSAFNREIIRQKFDKSGLLDLGTFDEEPMYQFDAKAWICPEKMDVFSWVLFRNTDCIRNSKQQAAQTYLKYDDELVRKNTDEQIELLLKKTGIDWNDYDAGVKYGRLVRHEAYTKMGEYNGKIVPVERHRWRAYPVEKPLNTEEGRAAFFELADKYNWLPEKKEEI